MQPAVTSARVPPEIQAMKPKGFGHVQVLRFRHKDSEYYYVYQISYEKLDKAVNGRGWRKKTGRVIGSISGSDGFIPNRYGMSLIRKKATVPQASGGLPFKNYGAYAMLRALSPEIGDGLRMSFPDEFREIMALALMRLVERTSKAAAMKEIFDNCYLSLEAPDLSMSERLVLAFTEALGRREDDCRAFMRAYVGKASTLLFDGTSLFTREGDLLAQKGYNPDHSLNTQVRLLYMFEKESHRPVFYTMLQGSLVDRAAFINAVRLSGEEERKPMDVVSETRRGYFAFVSNLDKPAEEIYLLYKKRWDIEECFDYLKNDVAPEASHASSNDFLKGWAFINHVSLLYYYGLINALHEVGIDSDTTPRDALRIARSLIKQIPAGGGRANAESGGRRHKQVVRGAGDQL